MKQQEREKNNSVWEERDRGSALENNLHFEKQGSQRRREKMHFTCEDGGKRRRW